MIKTKVNIRIVAFRLLGAFVLIFVPCWIYYEEYDYYFDFETFEIKSVLLLFFGFSLLARTILGYMNSRFQFSEKGIRRIGGLDGFIPKNEVEGYEQIVSILKIHTQKGILTIDESFVRNFDEILEFAKENYPVFSPQKKQDEGSSKCLFYVFLLLLFAVISFTGYFDGFRYQLPLSPVKVVEIEGILTDKDEHFYYGFRLEEYPEYYFHFPSLFKLPTDTTFTPINRILEPKSRVKIKIRKEDFEYLQAPEQFEEKKKRIRFYELKIGEDIYMRKHFIQTENW